MQWKKKLASFHYASPPPPSPLDVIPPPQVPYYGYYYSSPPPSSYADPPSSRRMPPPPPASSPPAFEPPGDPVAAYSPPPPPPAPPLSPPPVVIPPTSSIYYQSPPPPSHMPPPPSPCPPPISSPPLPYVSNSNPPISSPMLHRSPPLPPSATPSRAKTQNFHSLPRDTHPVQRHNGPLRNSMSTASTVATVAAVAGIVMLTFVGAAVWLMKKQRKPIELIGNGGNVVMLSPASSHMSGSSHARSPSYPLVRHGSEGSYGFPYSPSEPGLGHAKLWFTLEELSTITNNFSAENLLGEGGSGCVYKGCLSDGREVAIKQLKVGGAQGDRQFRAEVETISRAHHRHLVSLVGYCVSENERLLVYDYVPNRTLYYHLHVKRRPVMEWTTRVKVAVGAAHGIAYLHEDCNPRIIHRDIKSSNILLDYNFEAKVSDFGLARAATDGNTHVSTHVMGTFGYLAPEYAKTGKLTAKSDVYSFGVVLLELITGLKPVDKSRPLGDENLAEWARPLLIQAIENEDFGCLPDPRLDGNFDRGEMFQMIELAAACIRHSSTMRPRMAQVVRVLDGLSDLDINNGVRPGHSEVFTSSPHSEEIRMFQMMEFED